jgi:hypothetical protein
MKVVEINKNNYMNIKLFCDPIFDQTIISETISDLHEA